MKPARESPLSRGRRRGSGNKPRAARRGKPSPEKSAAITQAIIEAAAEMFLQDGFEGTAMEAVAAKLGIPKRTLYRRFADKTALLNAVLVERVNAWSGITSQQNAMLTDDLPQRLKQYVTTMLVWANRAEVRAFTKLFATAEGLSGKRNGRFGFYGQAQMLDLIAHDIAEFGPTQGIRAKEPLRVAQVLMALLSGWLDFRSSDAPCADVAAAEDAGMLVELLLRGREAW